MPDRALSQDLLNHRSLETHIEANAKSMLLVSVDEQSKTGIFDLWPAWTKFLGGELRLMPLVSHKMSTSNLRPPVLAALAVMEPSMAGILLAVEADE